MMPTPRFSAQRSPALPPKKDKKKDSRIRSSDELDKSARSGCWAASGHEAYKDQVQRLRRARPRVQASSWAIALGIGVAALIPRAANAKGTNPNTDSSADSLVVEGANRCLRADKLRITLRRLRPERWPAGQRIVVTMRQPGAQVELFEGSTLRGTRSFEGLPGSCKARRQLIATVIALALDDPASFGDSSQSSPGSAKAGSGPNQGVDSSAPGTTSGAAGAQSSAPTPGSKRAPKATQNQSTGAGTQAKKSAKDSGSAPASNETPNREPKAQAASNRRDTKNKNQETRANEEETSDSPNNRSPRRSKPQRPRRKIAPPTPDWSLGVGSGFGKTTFVEGHLEVSRGWAFEKAALRPALLLIYSPPSKLGPGRVHSGLAALRLRACARGASIAVAPGTPELCLGVAGGGFAVGGLGLSKNATGFSPWVGVSLSAEIPVYRGPFLWMAISAEVTAAPLRPSVSVDIFEDGSDKPIQTTTRPIHLMSGSGVLVFRWPRS